MFRSLNMTAHTHMYRFMSASTFKRQKISHLDVGGVGGGVDHFTPESQVHLTDFATHFEVNDSVGYF